MNDIVTEGYELIRGVLDHVTVTTLRQRIDTAVTDRVDAVDVRAGTVWVRDAGILGPEVGAAASSSAVISAVAALLGPGPVVVSSVMRNPVGATAQQALHVDWAGAITPGDDQQAQAMFYLDDVDTGNGPTRLVPRSHRSGATPPKYLSDPRAVHRDQLLVSAAAGDVLVFSAHLWHSGTANRTGRARRAITVTYRGTTRGAQGQPATKAS